MNKNYINNSVVSEILGIWSLSLDYNFVCPADTTKNKSTEVFIFLFFNMEDENDILLSFKRKLKL